MFMSSSQSDKHYNPTHAGRQFFTVEEMLFSAHHASYEECLEAGIHCFLMAIDVRRGRVMEGVASFPGLSEGGERKAWGLLCVHA